MKHPSWSYKFELEYHRLEYLEAFNRVLDSGKLLFGSELESLEREFAEYIGAEDCVGCDNATNALFLALKAVGVGPGDEVICVANTAIPTISAIVHAGATPVLVDVDIHGLMDIRLVEEAITKNTKVILPVHLYGYPVDMKRLMSLASSEDILVIEDCSQAHGASIEGKRVGSFGDLSCFSFYPTKPLGAYGDAGIICTNGFESDVLRRLRFYGISKGYVADMHGYNSRMDEIQAAILRAKLNRLDSSIKYRSAIAKKYASIESTAIKRLDPPSYADKISGYLIPHLLLADRKSFIKSLERKGIGVNISYPVPIHLMPAFKDLGNGPGTYPVSEFLCERVFSPPVADYYPLGDIDNIVMGIQEALLEVVENPSHIEMYRRFLSGEL